MKKAVIIPHYKEYVDKKTGEVKIIEENKLVVVKLGRDEKFWMTYCKYTSPIYQLTYADDIKVIVKFCELAEYESGIVHLTPARRKEMVAELGMQQSNVSKSIKRLKEKNLVTGDNGEYVISPLIFWKGDRSKRLEYLKNKGLTVTFNFTVEDKYGEQD